MTGSRLGRRPLGGLVACLALGATAALATLAQSPTTGEWVGSWSGAIDEEDGSRTEIRLTVERADGSGAWVGHASIDGGDAVAIDGLEITGSLLRGTLNTLPGEPSFELRRDVDSGQLAGEITRALIGLPATDVYLLQVERHSEGWRLGELRNLTDRDAYDNQPRFSRDGRRLLYTAQAGSQTEIHAYDLETRKTARLTETPEGEYSPTPLPDGVESGDRGFSTVRTALDGTQHLWAWADDGSEPRLLLPDVEPVGYHGWIDAETVALFVLGDPPSLVLASLTSGERRTLAERIGRSIHRVPGRRAVSFVFKEDGDRWWIRSFDLDSGETRDLIETPPGNEDFIWLADGRLLSAVGARLVVAGTTSAEPAWTPVLDLAEQGVGTISRLAEDAESGLLAVVGQRPAPPPVRTARPLRLTRSVPAE